MDIASITLSTPVRPASYGCETVITIIKIPNDGSRRWCKDGPRNREFKWVFIIIIICESNVALEGASRRRRELNTECRRRTGRQGRGTEAAGNNKAAGHLNRLSQREILRTRITDGERARKRRACRRAAQRDTGSTICQVDSPIQYLDFGCLNQVSDPFDTNRIRVEIPVRIIGQPNDEDIAGDREFSTEWLPSRARSAETGGSHLLIDSFRREQHGPVIDFKG